MTETAAQNRLLARIGYGSKPGLAVQTGQWRFRTPVYESKLSPCRAACPAGSAIPAWLVAFGTGDHAQAWEIICRENPFPAITARVCFRFCEVCCNRGNLDQALQVHRIAEAIGAWRHRHFQAVPAPVQKRASVAVVGSGPAGLSCAFYLIREGYRVTVYEKEAVAGGLLVTGIPEYRLPRAVLAEELAMLSREGVVFRLNCTVGTTVPLKELYREHDAVFLAAGASRPARLLLPGLDEAAAGITALDFLRRVNLGEEIPVCDPVIVIGGGSAALDAARLARRRDGITAVTVVYRRDRAAMPSDPEGVSAAEAEGVNFLFNRVPVALRGESGTRRLVLARSRSSARGEKLSLLRPEENTTLPCGTLIEAIGQEADWSVFGALSSGCILFAGGDLVTGPDTVPAAIAAGRNAARAITARLEGNAPPDDINGDDDGPIRLADLHLHPSTAVLLRPTGEGLTGEAQRCLGCGTCTGCGLCYLFCPDLAIEPCDGHYRFNLDYCKGCGVCVRECPARALSMGGDDDTG